MTYSGELVMPTSYVEVAEEEMTYLDGGLSLKVNPSMLNKTYCNSLGIRYNGTNGLSRLRIAKEIYAHALMYYTSTALSWYASCLFGLGTAAVNSALSWIRKHSNPIDIGGDSSFRVAVFDAIWKYF